MDIFTEDQKQQFKERLKKNLSTKFQTTMIFPLAAFESAFGFLWKHNEPYESLTEDEKWYRDAYEDMRQGVLDNGNRQLRNAVSELENYEIVLKRYHATLVFNNGNLKEKN